MGAWREKAEECREKAERVRDPAARRSFLQMARCYDDLADQLEKRAERSEETARLC